MIAKMALQSAGTPLLMARFLLVCSFSWVALVVGACGGDDEEETSAECRACSGVNYRCNFPTSESFDVRFESGGQTECTGKRVMSGFSVNVRLACDFSQLCEESQCFSASKTADGFVTAPPPPNDAMTCTKFK